MSNELLCDLGKLYRKELLANVVPYWQSHSVDYSYGGFFTCLDRKGQRYSSHKYMWLQSRAVWMFARLHNVISTEHDWLDLAEIGADFIRKYGRNESGRVYFSLTRDGRPIHLQRKIYSEVFYVLAMVEMAKATGQSEYLEEARDLFWKVYDWWNNPRALGRPILSGTMKGSTLADPMVFLCMIEELFSIDPDSKYEDVAEDMKQLALRHVVHDQGTVLENVGPNGEFIDTPSGRLLNPGHAIEMGWCLVHMGERTNDVNLVNQAIRIIERSFERGWDAEYGGLYYFLDAANKPSLKLEWSMKLWWPAVEAIYALLLAWRVSKDDKFIRMHDKIHKWAFEHFRDPEYGEWYGYLDRYGNVTHDLKGGEWKGFFHLPRSLLFCTQICSAV